VRDASLILAVFLTGLALALAVLYEGTLGERRLPGTDRWRLAVLAWWLLVVVVTSAVLTRLLVVLFGT
jgi:hypothetical protein